MKNNVLFTKTTLLTIILSLGMSYASMAATYTATASGNWSSSTTWGGTGAPSFNISGADNIIISAAVIVTLDQNLTINNATASLDVLATGALTGATYNLMLTTGTLMGAGTVTLNSLTVGAGGLISSVGAINVATFTNSAAALAISSVITVTNTVALDAGVVQLNTLGAINLANNAAINMAGGAYSTVGGGVLTLAGTFNLIYSGVADSLGLESVLAGLNNVTVNLASATDQLRQTAPLAITGLLTLTQGILNLNGHSLTLNGGINSASMGSILGNATSDIIVNGTGSAGTIAFAAAGDTIRNLTMTIAGTGSLLLASNAVIAGTLALNASSLNLNGHNLTLDGTITAAGVGSIIGSATSGLTVNGTGAVGTLAFGASGTTLGNMVVNIAAAGTVLLGSALTVAGTLALNGGSLVLNAQTLTIGGAISATGTGSITGDAVSNIVFNGTGNAGTLVFTTAGQLIHNLTVNIGGSGTVALGSNATVGGMLTLAQGNIVLGNNSLTIPVAGVVQGGSAASYVVTNDAGSLIMTVANAGAAAMYQVGTLANYAPVNLTNNSTLAGIFNVIAHPGVFANGTIGTDLSLAQSVVNTSWDVTSSLVTGANVNLEMFWNTAMQVNGFDNTQAFVSHYTSGAWNTNTLAAATAHAGGTYSLALNGVTSFSPFAVFDKNTVTSISDVKADATFSIYPNPASDMLTVTTLEVNNNSTLKTTVDISAIAPGVYLASINNVATKRFIKR